MFSKSQGCNFSVSQICMINNDLPFMGRSRRPYLLRRMIVISRAETNTASKIVRTIVNTVVAELLSHCLQVCFTGFSVEMTVSLFCTLKFINSKDLVRYLHLIFGFVIDNY